MHETDPALLPPPSAMSEEAFVVRFGAVYEHSSWISGEAWRRGLIHGAQRVSDVAAALARVVEESSREAQDALIRAHPDLGARAAVGETLTCASRREQAGAGLNRCTPEEFARLQALNRAYRDKFGFPFIVAVKGLQRQQILAAMAERLENGAERERRRALDEIHTIARLRLLDLATGGR